MTAFKNCKICKSEITTINQKLNLARCVKCKLIFCTKIYAQSEFIKIYKDLYNNENAVYSNHSIVEYNNLLKNKIKIGYNREQLIKKHVLNSNCKSVLEIGSGIGLIGSYLRNKNKNIDYLGIEIDEESYIKSQFLKLNTINADFTVMESITQTYDVIMLWEVIEHLQDLNLFIELVFKRLNKGGKVLLSTPNYDKIFNYKSRFTDEIYQDEPPIHLNFYTTESLVNIFEFNHFKTCKATVKKLPYIAFKNLNFYKDLYKLLMNKYNGSTIYFLASK